LYMAVACSASPFLDCTWERVAACWGVKPSSIIAASSAALARAQNPPLASIVWRDGCVLIDPG